VTNCRCLTPPFDYRDYESRSLGLDTTHGRYGEVSLQTCRHCGTTWLSYLVEYEAFTASGRWVRGAISSGQAQTLTPEQAIAVLEQLPWHFVGGSAYRSTGQRSTRPIRADI